MEFLKASEEDAQRIMEIIGQAQKYLREQGVNQWQNNYPNIGTVLNDIQNGNCHVLRDNGRVVGTVTVIFDGEKTYERIYEGNWLSRRKNVTLSGTEAWLVNNPSKWKTGEPESSQTEAAAVDPEYAAIHRIAIDHVYKGRGLASHIISGIEAMCRDRGIGSIRVDTHRQNASMRRMLEKNGFVYCGIIYLSDNSERIAFEKILPHI